MHFTSLYKSNICYFADFSLTAWLASHAVPSVDDMTVPRASELLMELGLDHFLDSTDRCSLSDTVYGAADVDGWNNGIDQAFTPIYIFSLSGIFFCLGSFQCLFLGLLCM